MPPRRWEWVRGFLVLMLGTLLVLLTDLILEIGSQDSPDYPPAPAGSSPQDGEPQVGFDPQPGGWGSPAAVQDPFTTPPVLRPY